jgi:hypothetical protein
MSALAQLQGEFQDYLLRGALAVQERVKGSARVPASIRLAIYGNAYQRRLADALASNFPALARLLGESDFATLADSYVREHDSPFFNIRYYGDALPGFLATHEHYLAAPVLAELARWEWAMMAAFDAADAAVLDHAALAQLSPEKWAQLRFTFHPSLQRLGLKWNVPQLWQALTDDGVRPEVSVQAEPIQWLVWRQQLSSYFRSLSPIEAAALDAARSGWPFGELCELLCEEVGEAAAAQQAATLLRGWVASALITQTG